MLLGRIRSLRYEVHYAVHRAFVAASVYKKYSAFTMISRDRFITNLALCQRRAPKQGCIVECGVWRGGMSAGIADTLPGRRHFLFDSFEGLPPARKCVDGEKAVAYQRDVTSPRYHDNCTAEIGYAERAMRRSAAGEYRLIKGWFNKTVPNFVPPEPIAVLRLDGDWYDSTMECLRGLHRYVAPRGLVIVDDYYDWDGCSRAIHDFLSETKSTDRLRSVNGVCFWCKQPGPA